MSLRLQPEIMYFTGNHQPFPCEFEESVEREVREMYKGTVITFHCVAKHEPFRVRADAFRH